ncbi:MAG: aldolase/citrate lyase family protein [Sporichthyaceae bacterium]
MPEPHLLPPGLGAELDARLSGIDAELVSSGVRARTRQPVHTAYVPADRFTPATASEWGSAALAALREHAPEAAALGVDADVYRRVVAKLEREPVEDLRVDFEDGYGARPDDEEDADAVRAGAALREPATAGCGIRIKSLEATTRERALRTLDRLLGACGRVPAGFVVTLPKVSVPEQVIAMREICDAVGTALRGGPLRFELQVETPRAVARMGEIVAAAGPHCAGLHYGTYDYSASLGIAAAHQSLDHPAADHAKSVMQVAAATVGIPVVDGSSNVLPVGDRKAVRAAWDLHRGLVHRSMVRGFYQGWDLHPAQLVSRYAAVFSFYREGLDAAGRRVRAYADRVSGGVLDEPATARALTGYLLRGLDCGALDESEVVTVSGLDRNGLVGLS